MQIKIIMYLRSVYFSRLQHFLYTPCFHLLKDKLACECPRAINTVTNYFIGNFFFNLLKDVDEIRIEPIRNFSLNILSIILSQSRDYGIQRISCIIKYGKNAGFFFFNFSKLINLDHENCYFRQSFVVSILFITGSHKSVIYY